MAASQAQNAAKRITFWSRLPFKGVYLIGAVLTDFTQ